METAVFAANNPQKMRNVFLELDTDESKETADYHRFRIFFSSVSALSAVR